MLWFAKRLTLVYYLLVSLAMNIVGRRTLELAPLPHWPASPAGEIKREIQQDFVDDQVVEAILLRSSRPVSQRDNAELVLSSDEMDFAGWHALPRTAPFPVATGFPKKSAEVSSFDEPGIGSPRREAPRWWIVALATLGSVAALGFALITTQPVTKTGKSTTHEISSIFQSLRKTVSINTAGTF